MALTASACAPELSRANKSLGPCGAWIPRDGWRTCIRIAVLSRWPRCECEQAGERSATWRPASSCREPLRTGKKPAPTRAPEQVPQPDRKGALARPRNRLLAHANRACHPVWHPVTEPPESVLKSPGIRSEISGFGSDRRCPAAAFCIRLDRATTTFANEPPSREQSK